MGSSGADKTTLMGGTIRGEILLNGHVNGHVATDLDVRRATGYREQIDIHSETAMLREALQFSAMAPTSRPQSASHRPSSRSLTTSCCSSGAARTVFFGELGTNATHLIKYFIAFDGPATWMLEVIGVGICRGTHETDFVDVYKQSKTEAGMDRAMATDGVIRPAQGVVPLAFCQQARGQQPHAGDALDPAVPAHVLALAGVQHRARDRVRRARIGHWALLPRARLWHVLYGGINSGVGMLFVVALFIGQISFQSIMLPMCDDRNAFYCERAAQTYNAAWYLVGATLAEVPYVFASVLLFSVVFFPWPASRGPRRLSPSVDPRAAACVHGAARGVRSAGVGVAATIGTLILILFMSFNPPAELIPVSYKGLHVAKEHTRDPLEPRAWRLLRHGDRRRRPQAAGHAASAATRSLGRHVHWHGLSRALDDTWTDVAVVLCCIAAVR